MLVLVLARRRGTQQRATAAETQPSPHKEPESQVPDCDFHSRRRCPALGGRTRHARRRAFQLVRSHCVYKMDVADTERGHGGEKRSGLTPPAPPMPDTASVGAAKPPAVPALPSSSPARARAPAPVPTQGTSADDALSTLAHALVDVAQVGFDDVAAMRDACTALIKATTAARVASSTLRVREAVCGHHRVTEVVAAMAAMLDRVATARCGCALVGTAPCVQPVLAALASLVGLHPPLALQHPCLAPIVVACGEVAATHARQCAVQAAHLLLALCCNAAGAQAVRMAGCSSDVAHAGVALLQRHADANDLARMGVLVLNGLCCAVDGLLPPVGAGKQAGSSTAGVATAAETAGHVALAVLTADGSAIRVARGGASSDGTPHPALHCLCSLAAVGNAAALAVVRAALAGAASAAMADALFTRRHGSEVAALVQALLALARGSYDVPASRRARLQRLAADVLLHMAAHDGLREWLNGVALARRMAHTELRVATEMACGAGGDGESVGAGGGATTPVGEGSNGASAGAGAGAGAGARTGLSPGDEAGAGDDVAVKVLPTGGAGGRTDGDTAATAPPAGDSDAVAATDAPAQAACRTGEGENRLAYVRALLAACTAGNLGPDPESTLWKVGTDAEVTAVAKRLHNPAEAPVLALIQTDLRRVLASYVKRQRTSA